jgi:hypothetical protein
MSMVFCRGCGKEIHESAISCPFCGALQNVESSYNSNELPKDAKGWSWGAFVLTFIWGIANRTWISLLVLIPFIGFIMTIILGVKGREWAWKNKDWDSIEHFKNTQAKWDKWGLILFLLAIVLGIVAGVLGPSYLNYTKKAAFSEVILASVAPKLAVELCMQSKQNAFYCTEETDSFIKQTLSNIPNVSSATVYSKSSNVLVIKLFPIPTNGIGANDFYALEGTYLQGGVTWSVYSGIDGCRGKGLC